MLVPFGETRPTVGPRVVVYRRRVSGDHFFQQRGSRLTQSAAGLMNSRLCVALSILLSWVLRVYLELACGGCVHVACVTMLTVFGTCNPY